MTGERIRLIRIIIMRMVVEGEEKNCKISEGCA